MYMIHMRNLKKIASSEEIHDNWRTSNEGD